MGREDVIVKKGFEYDHYFPKAQLLTITKKKGATVADTLLLIPAVIRETASHTKRFAQEIIKADTIEQTCRNIWEFVYGHIAYQKDEDGKEQVRSPARTWHDRQNRDENGKQKGVDCDCMTVFVVSVLYNLNIKNIYFRITKYKEKHFEHIYPIVILPSGRQITIDCVVHNFNYEEPYSEKKDKAMDLEYLNGVTNSPVNRISDAADLMGMMDEQEALSALGKILKRKKASGGGSACAPANKKTLFKKPLFTKKTAEQKAKRKVVLKKGLHTTNRVNPVTLALRNGVLAGMKLNFLKVAESLRYTYLSEQEAQRRGIIMDKFRKLKTVREKLDTIFYGAGGKVENLKKAILTGRGNRDKSVPLNGLGYIPYENLDGLHEDMPLSQLLGREIFHSENVEGLQDLEGFEGLQGFGEVGQLGIATAASVAAASTVLTTIAGLIKSIGSIFPKKASAETNTKKIKTGNKKPLKRSGGNSSDGGGSSEESDGGNSTEASSEEVNNENGASSNESSSDNNNGENEDANNDEEKKEGDSDSSSDNESTNGSENTNKKGAQTALTKKAEDNMDDNENNKPSATLLAKAKLFWENNKKWIKPTGVAVGTLSLVALAYKLLKPKAKNKLALNGLKKKKKPAHNLLNGIKHKKKGGHGHLKKQHSKMKSISLL